MAENNENAPQCAIMVHVIDQDDYNHFHFKIKKDTPLKRLMISYCERTGSDMEKTEFRFDGTLIRDEDSASTMGIVDDDTIDVINVLDD
ncbi:small ubiquitin-related modifier 2-A-like isoform X3 [Rhopalosiphum padi]|uniref:small ubiquitin-related modifier 2-A-like isoform X3 n=1 Tax=Rhopalosiphum padi TaxID=40932 RepID=UPI00298E91CC|nr:small ubiquitin-related modifier 2-A-like isoform X3 [Rhopalosiphum padi]